MATSGSTDFTVTRNDVITEALELCQVLAEGESPSGNDLKACNRSLNVLIKSWQADGLHLWQQQEVTLFHTKGTTKYTLGTTKGSASHVETTLSAAEAAAQTVLSITDTTGMTADDNIGIELDDGTRQWTTITSVDSSTQVTIDTALAGAAASANTIFTFTTQMGKPLRVLSARRRTKAGNEVPVFVHSREDYMELADKTTQGKVVQVFYDQNGDGSLYVWPTADDVSDMLNMTVERKIEDFDAATDNPDVPTEWFKALSWGLASDICAKYGLPVQERAYLKTLADEHKLNLMYWDNEDEPVMFGPEQR